MPIPEKPTSVNETSTVTARVMIATALPTLAIKVEYPFFRSDPELSRAVSKPSVILLFLSLNLGCQLEEHCAYKVANESYE